MDWLDIAKPSKEYTATGRYYEDIYVPPESGGQSFRYKYVDPLSRTYRILFGNVQSEDRECTIATVDRLPYKIGSYVKTQDGRTFMIKQIQQDFSDAPKQALRILPVPAGTKYVIRMVESPDAWGVT